ncbi:hypothetical protein [Nostoc parmelioides]|uniref:Core-binding (CB) domain-containing protein n=1 Tax=Nostoc parmelioides FACHB-3921 TaxID=2692909 RepID=A0ABR8BP84_9NOSO|nr:hypothetical protein [Nostoc parmelioides]MBD2254710.1 hypothetical protein [Nostoc parmelioides FACHB-3921]
MQESLSLQEVLELYAEKIRTDYKKEQAERILNELRSGIFRFLLPEFGWKRTSSGRKMTNADATSALEFMNNLEVKLLLKALQVLQQAFTVQKVSTATRNIYGNRINQFLKWSEQQEWWPKRSVHLSKIKDQCCPVIKNPYGDTSNTPLTERRRQYPKYTLKPQYTPAPLQKKLDEFYRYLTSPEWPLRVVEPISESSADEYVKEIRLMLGWCYQYRTPSINLESLSLTHLFPLISQEDLEHLSSREQAKLWKQHKQSLSTLLCDYFQFLRSTLLSKSPQTIRNKLTALATLGKFLYLSEVEEESDYAQIPLFKLINNQLDKVRKEISEWTRNRQSVVDFEKKWPDTKEGETALSVIRAKIVEPLRQECRPRTSRGILRRGFVIAKSIQHYLKWSFLADRPARRQQEYRTLKIALSCPINRPESVPADGLYHPLPQNEVREKRWDGTIKDNYLYKTYVHEKKHYPEGVWVLDVQNYKTRKSHAPQSIVVPNRKCPDETSFYDYLERYLYGWWMPVGYKNKLVYDWWQPELLGKPGRWVTHGRAEFNPGDACCLPTSQNSTKWSWGYVFVEPDTGAYADGPSFGGSFHTTSHRLIGKRITPHTMRYIWATWAFQVRLSDAELRSLAHYMGHTLETLRQMYERSTPEEKRRPIEEAINELLFEQTPEPVLPQKQETQQSFQTLLIELQKLSPAEREHLLNFLSS